MSISQEQDGGEGLRTYHSVGELAVVMKAALHCSQASS